MWRKNPQSKHQREINVWASVRVNIEKMSRHIWESLGSLGCKVWGDETLSTLTSSRLSILSTFSSARNDMASPWLESSKSSNISMKNGFQSCDRTKHEREKKSMTVGSESINSNSSSTPETNVQGAHNQVLVNGDRFPVSFFFFLLCSFQFFLWLSFVCVCVCVRVCDFLLL